MSHEKLMKQLTKYNTEDLVTGLIEYQMMDMIDENRLYKCELLAGLLVKNTIQFDKKIMKMRDFEYLYDLSQQVVNKQTSKILNESIKQAKNGGDVKALEKSFQMRIKHLYHRGDGYIHQILEFAQNLYGKFDEEISRNFGFSFTECKNIYIYIFQNYMKKTDNLLLHCKELISSGNRNPDLISTINYDYRIVKEEIYKVFGKGVVDSWLSHFNVSPSEKTNTQFKSLLNFNILYAKPIIDFGDYFYLLLPINALQNLHKIFHYEFIANKTFSKDIVEAYKAYRGQLLEETTIKYLRRLFKTKEVKDSLYYFEDGHNLEEDYRYEADVTVQRDEITLLCECKSKLLVLNSLKGNIDSIENDVKAAIIKANEQADRTRHYIKNRKEIYKRNKSKNLERVYLRNTKEYIKICVVADHFGWIPSSISNYLKSNNLPLVINIFDLDLLTKESKDYREFLKYLILKRNNLDNLQSIDELEIFCAYKNGNIPEGKDTIVFFDGYTEDMDEKFYKNEYDWLMNYTFD